MATVDNNENKDFSYQEYNTAISYTWKANVLYGGKKYKLTNIKIPTYEQIQKIQYRISKNSYFITGDSTSFYLFVEKYGDIEKFKIEDPSDNRDRTGSCYPLIVITL